MANSGIEFGKAHRNSGNSICIETHTKGGLVERPKRRKEHVWRKKCLSPWLKARGGVNQSLPQ
jgi:hypothetical protein